MELKDVTSFCLLEQYLKERNQFINFYELNLIQWILSFLEEKQLFFLVQKDFFSQLKQRIVSENMENYLSSQYHNLIKDKYDMNHKTGIAVSNSEGKFEMEYWNQTFPFPYDKSREEQEEDFDEISLGSNILEGKDYITIMKNKEIQIITFLIKARRFYCKDVNNNEFGLEKFWSYDTHLERKNLIIPSKDSWSTSVFVESHGEMSKKLNSSQMQMLANYYVEQKQILEEYFQQNPPVSRSLTMK